MTTTTVHVQVTGRSVTVNGQAITVPPGFDPRQGAIVHIAGRYAEPTGATVGVELTDENGTQQLRVTPQGAVELVPAVTAQQHDAPTPSVDVAADPAGPLVEEDPREIPAPVVVQETVGDPSRAVRRSARQSTAAVNPLAAATAPATAPVREPAVALPAPVQDVPVVEPVGAPTRRPRQQVSFLVSPQEELASRTIPSSGFAGWLERVGLKSPSRPSAAQVQAELEEHALSQHWAGPRTIAVVNPKGSANKTPTVAMLAAQFARHGGGGVLAWDNNETRGTLGWRTEQGPHDQHVRALLDAAPELLGEHARVSDMAGFVHHQSRDRYDVLRSDPRSVRPQDRITAEEFDLLHRVAARYYRLLVIDSGNNEAAPNWLAAVSRADVIVVATTTGADQSEAARLMLEHLAHGNERSARLARTAIAVVSQVHPADPAAAGVVEQFGQLCGGAVAIPMDPGMRSQRLRVEGLAPATQDAWRHAAATVAHTLATAVPMPSPSPAHVGEAVGVPSGDQLVSSGAPLTGGESW